MGLEIKTRARHKGGEAFGHLHLDSRSLTFRSRDFKWSAELSAAVKAKAADGWLVVRIGRDKTEFEVGAAADRWVDKILHPPSRLEKLGVKPAVNYWSGSQLSADFVKELDALKAVQVKKLKDCQLAFLRLEHRDELGKLLDAARQLPAKTNLWVLWPKGVPEITQAEVMNTAASCGMGPSKAASFDDRYSSQRFAKKSLG